MNKENKKVVENVIHPDSSAKNDHIVGNKECVEGYCNGGFNYPKKCGCGGLIHVDFGDENFDGDYWLYTKCDKCGESE